MPPDYLDFHRSIAAELEAVKNRVRSLVNHWGEDGAHKEAVLRAVLRRHLPDNVTVGTGFIVGDGQASAQVDILIVDKSRPTLFRDGDLLFVTPNGVRAVVEVKANLENAGVAATVEKLGEVALQCPQPIWTGLFGFEKGNVSHDLILKALEQARATTGNVVNGVCGGQNDFFLHWDAQLMCGGPAGATEFWRSYELQGLAPSYFLGNLVYGCSDHVGQVGNFAWFPIREGGGKEQYRRRQIAPGMPEPEEAPPV